VIPVDDPVEVTRVANGYIVKPFYQGNGMTEVRSIHVFESKESLFCWLADHFTEASAKEVG
jgi:hypothetical protein